MIPLSRKAEIAYRTLDPEDMKQVQKSMDLLNRYPLKYLSTDKVKKLTDFDDLFIMKATSDLRIIFQMTDSDKEITDIVRYKRLEKMFGI